MTHVGTVHVEAAIEALAKDSDRAAAIVAAAIVETHLQSALKRAFHDYSNDIKFMFELTGPLGSFEAKIRMALLLGLISKELKQDLMAVKDIRNRFAHRLDTEDFKNSEINKKCANLNLFGTNVVESPPLKKYLREIMDPNYPGDNAKFRMMVPNLRQKIKDNKRRYIIACQYFATFLVDWRRVNLLNSRIGIRLTVEFVHL